MDAVLLLLAVVGLALNVLLTALVIGYYRSRPPAMQSVVDAINCDLLAMMSVAFGLVSVMLFVRAVTGDQDVPPESLALVITWGQQFTVQVAAAYLSAGVIIRLVLAGLILLMNGRVA